MIDSCTETRVNISKPNRMHSLLLLVRKECPYVWTRWSRTRIPNLGAPSSTDILRLCTTHSSLSVKWTIEELGSCRLCILPSTSNRRTVPRGCQVQPFSKTVDCLPRRVAAARQIRNGKICSSNYESAMVHLCGCLTRDGLLEAYSAGGIIVTISTCCPYCLMSDWHALHVLLPYLLEVTVYIVFLNAICALLPVTNRFTSILFSVM
jgi:hypothetical protein